MSEHFLILRPWIPLDKLDWFWLSANSAAIHLLEQNPDKIYWHQLSLKYFLDPSICLAIFDLKMFTLTISE